MRSLTSPIAETGPPDADEQPWEQIVDSALPQVWSVTQAFDLPTDEATSVCELVFLRLLERRNLQTISVTELINVIRGIALAECEKQRRLSAWRSAPAHVPV